MQNFVYILNFITIICILIFFVFSIKSIMKSKSELKDYRKKLSEKRKQYEQKVDNLNKNGGYFR